MRLQHQINNALLASMAAADFAAIIAGASEVALEAQQELALPGDQLNFCWFPLGGLISVIAADANDKQAEIGVVGAEGVADPGCILGDPVSVARLLVQIPGSAIRVRLETLRRCMADSRALSRLMLAYARTQQIQLGGSALAYAQYTIEQRLARWLLMCADRVGPERMPLTHETLSIMLGVRRAGVTVALQGLAGKGAIKAGRGNISVIDRGTLLTEAGVGYGEPEAAYPPADRQT